MGTVMKLSERQDAPVRVLVVDDQQLVRDGIASLLRVQDGIEVLATATNGQEAIEAAVNWQPDVILMDIRMPIMDGVTATIQLRRQIPSCHILMLTTFDDDEYVKDALQAEAHGYLLKDIPASDLALAVRAASQGISQFDPSIVGKVVASFVAFSVYFTLLGRIGAARTGYTTVMYPVVALLISTFAEDYRWSFLAALGLAAVLIGNVLVLRAPRA